ncbi:uncharacterized protein LOC118557152 [Fundulus heteroclitus]|uniref:uncharacterized protein LOC118557152 n=1 Tax=Fundulus heteroclitus TaxID=8078 RepID=UPI00165C998F|nr:uncharacterized protein LOC118557152 [Fundulus heteroclitus]
MAEMSPLDVTDSLASGSTDALCSTLGQKNKYYVDAERAGSATVTGTKQGAVLRRLPHPGSGNMNTTDPDSNVAFTFHEDHLAVSGLTTVTTPPSVLQPSSHPADVHDPEFTIMLVLGSSLLLAGFAAFLAVCRRSEPEGDLEGSCAPGERLTRGKGLSTEPQLKTWRRLGSYRRSYNLSFRRPPYRRPPQPERTRVARPVASRAPEPDASTEPHSATPCLFDYVTEI